MRGGDGGGVGNNHSQYGYYDESMQGYHGHNQHHMGGRMDGHMKPDGRMGHMGQPHMGHQMHGRGPRNELVTLTQSTLISVLTMDDLEEPEFDGRQLVAKEVETCKSKLRTMLSFAKEILVLAESDFSFSASLCEFMIPETKMIATSFESEEKLSDYHKETFDENIGILKEHKASVFHEVDAGDIETTLGKSMLKKPDQSALKWSGTFDIVWLQLPHTGGTCKTNSKLIKRYLASVGRVLKPNGMAYLTLYGLQVAHWKLPLHAEAGRMNPVMKIPFGTGVFPAIWTIYNPRVGFSDTYFDILRQPCDTFIFVQNEFTPVHNFSAVTQN